MLAAYFDESFDTKQKKLFIAGGYLGRNSAWFMLEHRWKQLLNKYDLPFYHAKECEHGRGEFEKFRTNHTGHLTRDDRSRLTAIRMEFIDAARNGSDIAGIAMCVDLRDFHALCDTVEKRNAFGNTPFYFGYHLAMLMAVNDVRKYVGATTVAFVCDRHEQYSRTMKRTHASLRNTNPDLAATIGSLTFANKEEFVGLQVADMFLYEVKRSLEARFDDRLYPDRDELTALKAANNIYRIDICRKACIQRYLEEKGL